MFKTSFKPSKKRLDPPFDPPELIEEVRYPTAYAEEVPGTWVNPQYAVGEHDGYCAICKYAPTQGVTLERLFLSGFGFNIPSGAVLEHLTIGLHGVGYISDSVIGVAIKKVITFGWDSGLCPVIVCTCNRALDHEYPYDILDTEAYTPEDLNAENFAFWNYGVGRVATYAGLVDWSWIRVIYSVPVVVKREYMDGLVYVQY